MPQNHFFRRALPLAPYREEYPGPPQECVLYKMPQERACYHNYKVRDTLYTLTGLSPSDHAMTRIPLFIDYAIAWVAFLVHFIQAHPRL